MATTSEPRMKFECESCHAQYMIADEKVGKRGVKVKCKRCSHVIIVRPEGAPVEAAVVAPAMAAKEKPRVEQAERSKVSPTDAPPNLEATSPKPGHAAGDDPETTGPARPAPVSMMANKNQDTLLGDDDGASSEAPAPSWEADKTELGKVDLGLDAPIVAPAPIAASSEAPERTVVSPAVIPEALAPPPPPPPAPVSAVAAAKMPAVKGESSIGDALDDQLAGAFNNMFDEGRPGVDMLGGGENPEDQRGPTKVLDLDAMNALRKQTAARQTNNVDADALDSLRKDFSPQADESSGLWDEKNNAKKKAKDAEGADDGPAAAVWHAAIDDEDVGPLSLAELGRHIEAGRVDRDSLCWKSGMDDWLPASEIDVIRALFDKMPMPRIASEPESTGQKQKKSNSFDVGAPIDDMGMNGGGGGSPFDNAPPMEESDPAWRPHGLTDVYQAANLAEAAGSGAGFGGGLIGGGLIGGGAGMTARGGGPSAPPAPAEPEWRPSASSALSALVNDEIDRLSKGPMPADDDDLNAPRPADDAALSGGIGGGLGGLGGGGSLPFSNLAGVDLDAGPEVTDPSRRNPQAMQQNNGFDVAPPQFGGGGGFAPPAQAPGRSPLIYVAFAGMGLMMLLLIAVVAKVVLAPQQQQVVMIGPDGRPFNPGVPVAVTPPVTTPLTTTPLTTPPVTTPLTTTPLTTPPVTTTPPVDAATTPPTDATKVAVAETTPPVTTPDPKDPKTPKIAGTGVKPKTPKGVKAPVEKDDPPPVAKEPKATPKGCDPVLDFDCKPGGNKPEPKADAKDTLEKADILAVVKGALPKVKACGQKNKATGTIKMSWKIETSGKTNDVAVADQKYAGTPTGSCVVGVIKAMKFPASKKPPPPVSIPLPLQ